MRVPTLDEFIRAYGTRRYPSRLHVREPGFEVMYVRMVPRYLNEVFMNPVLDLSSVEATRPGNGTFTALVGRLRHDYPELPIFVESVLAERFAKKLQSLGFEPVSIYPQCWLLRPQPAAPAP